MESRGAGRPGWSLLQGEGGRGQGPPQVGAGQVAELLHRAEPGQQRGQESDPHHNSARAGQGNHVFFLFVCFSFMLIFLGG